MKKKRKQISTEHIDVSKLYGLESTLSRDDFIHKFEIDLNMGLDSITLSKNLDKYGNNELTKNKEPKWYNYFLKSLFSPFNSILLVITLVLLYTDIYLQTTPNFANIIVILILVLTSTLLDFFQEFKSNKAASKLRELVTTTVTVIRNSTTQKVRTNELTVNDIVLLSSGSMIPADLRILESNNLYVRQSTLTGESDSIKKLDESNLSIDNIKSLSDLDTICFMGTNVVSGTAKGVVIKNGNNTYLGQIANTITKTKQSNTSFEVGVRGISKLLIKFMLIMIPLVFFLNFYKHDLITSFTFAVAIAIGITPLLLPVILSSSLSKGAVKMSKKKTIVKSLDAIQSFGAMNILCTDKTGTLTDDNIVVDRYLNVYGKDDIRILKHSLLNAHFQTGVSSNIDNAIIEKSKQENIYTFISKYIKIDEIPFDFSRRRLSVVVSDGDKKQLITKGAIEEILNICTFIDFEGKVSPLTNELKSNILDFTKKLNTDGLRVIAICQKNNITIDTKFSSSDEFNMVLLGFISFLDPPKDSAASSLTSLNEHGIRTIILTGDNTEITKSIAKKIKLNSDKIILGADIDKLHDNALSILLSKYNIYAKLSPIQKSRIVKLLKNNNNIVGYMGDGINDSPSLINSDIGISVDTAVDIAKESADIILLEKNLDILLSGVTEGRKTFSNIMKYIKMAISFNFGEVSSVIIASIFLPFLPITPIQLLVQSLLYDFGQLTLPFDNVDDEYLKTPKKWNTKSLKRFMLFMGPISSCFDMIVFLSLWFIFKIHDAMTFQTVWFSYGVVSNLIGMHIIRTAKIPFIQSNASLPVYISSILLSIIAIGFPFTFLGNLIGLVPISYNLLWVILGVPIIYIFVALIAKRIYIKKYDEWI